MRRFATAPVHKGHIPLEYRRSISPAAVNARPLSDDADRDEADDVDGPVTIIIAGAVVVAVLELPSPTRADRADGRQRARAKDIFRG